MTTPTRNTRYVVKNRIESVRVDPYCWAMLGDEERRWVARRLAEKAHRAGTVRVPIEKDDRQ